ncbi:MAG TPA: heparinase II/III family protein [Planctomycetota bacterium]|nr:heparinase II/III family protein [Planctomycetota bacterium]
MNHLPLHIVLVITALLTQTGLAMEKTAKTPIEIPPRDKLLDTLRKGHPRLIALDSHLDRVRRLIDADPLAKQWCERLRKEAQGILSEPVCMYEIPDGLRLLATSRRVVSRIYRLGLFYRLDGDRRYAERAWQELEAAAKFPDWNNRHFLDTAEMAHAFAIGYDWLHDQWTPEQRAALRTAMIEKALNPALAAYRNKDDYRTKAPYGWWVTTTCNWNQVCNGGIGLAALAIADDEPALAAEILDHGLRSVQIAMARYAPDGGCDEGPGYWHYASDYNVGLLAGLESALGTDFGLSQIPGFSEAGMFPIYMNGPLDKAFNFADAGEGLIRAPELFWMARKFNQPAFARYERHAANLQVLDLLWLDSPGELAPAPELPLDKHFRGVEAATSRSAWNDARALFVGFKAGDNKANHGNLDLGSFVFDALGWRWALDLGADNYNMPGYFGRQRWDYYRMRTEGHNTLVINPEKTANQDPQAAVKITRFESKPDRAFAITDLTAAYAARSVRRGIALTAGRRHVLVQDEVELAQPGETWWFMHTKASAEVADDGRTAILRQGRPRLWLHILSPANAEFTVMDARPLPTSPNPEMQNKNEGVRKLAIRLADARDVTISVLMVPLEQNEEPPKELPDVKPLAEW